MVSCTVDTIENVCGVETAYAKECRAVRDRVVSREDGCVSVSILLTLRVSEPFSMKVKHLKITGGSSNIA